MPVGCQMKEFVTLLSGSARQVQPEFLVSSPRKGGCGAEDAAGRGGR